MLLTFHFAFDAYDHFLPSQLLVLRPERSEGGSTTPWDILQGAATHFVSQDVQLGQYSCGLLQNYVCRCGKYEDIGRWGVCRWKIWRPSHIRRRLTHHPMPLIHEMCQRCLMHHFLALNIVSIKLLLFITRVVKDVHGHPDKHPFLIFGNFFAH